MRKRYWLMLILQACIITLGTVYLLAQLPYEDPTGSGPLPEDFMQDILYSVLAFFILIMAITISTTFHFGLIREKLDKDKEQK